jgi:hypothetical protein
MGDVDGVRAVDFRFRGRDEEDDVSAGVSSKELLASMPQPSV